MQLSGLKVAGMIMVFNGILEILKTKPLVDCRGYGNPGWPVFGEFFTNIHEISHKNGGVTC